MEEDNLLEDVESSEPAATPESSPNYKYRYYSLPTIRFTNIIRVIIFLDAALSICLWATGGNGDYFVDNILHFHLTLSTFDLAIMSTVKCVLLFVLYSKLEEVTLNQIQDPYNISAAQRKKSLHIVIIVWSLAFFCYPVVKGGFILHAYLRDDTYQKMHLTYNILAISAAAFGFIELLFAFASNRAMQRLKVQRILHRLNEDYKEVNEEGQVISKKANIVRLTKLAKPELGLLCLAGVCLLGSVAGQTAAPLYFGMVVDSAQKSMASLNRTVLELLGIYLSSAILGMFRAFLFSIAGQRLVARLRKQLFMAVIKQDISFFDTNRTGELLNRLSSDTQVLQSAVTVNVSMLARYVLQILGSLVFMFVLNPSLTGVLLAVVPIISLGAVQYGFMVRNIRQRFQDRLADASTNAEEALSSIRTVRSFVGEKKSTDLYGNDIDKSYSEGKRLATAEATFTGVIGTVVAGAIALVLWYGGKLVFEKHITPGILTSFLLYTLNVAFAFGLISAVYGDFMQAVGASIRIFDLFDKQPDIPNEGGLELQKIDSLEFDNVCFTYPARPDNQVLKGLTFSINRGQMVALVGPSGGGKSTIVSLIERFYDPESGVIKLGDTDLKLLDANWYRKQMAVVSQEPTLFACSIKDNIAYGKEASMEEYIFRQNHTNCNKHR